MSSRITILQITVFLAGCILSFVPGHASRGAGIRITGTTDATVVQYVDAQLLAVTVKLPPSFFNGLLDDSDLSIHIQRLNDQLSVDDFCQFENKSFGYFDRKRKRIVISERLVELAMQYSGKADQSIDCYHRSIETTFKATLAHELAHLYDAFHRVSTRKAFSMLAQAPKRKRLFRKNRIKNYNAASSPDPYEFTNAREAFATNFEYYIFDPNFACAKPAYALFLDTTFGVTGTSSCGGFENILLHSQIAAENLNTLASLSPNRVYEIHYLHATEGPRMASRWGHAMLRIVVCAPFRTEVGPACLEDSAFHLVLSYRANIADITISYLRGLLGAYPSQLFIYELPEIIKEYTRLEFRNLVSIPLNFSQNELDYFLKLTLERYWNYQGKYFFISNHCGTETLNQVRAVNPTKAAMVRSLTPRKLLKTLKRSALVDNATYSTLIQSNEASVYFFPSKQSQYQAALDAVQRLGIFPGRSLDNVLNKMTSSERSVIYEAQFADSSYLAASVHEKQSILTNLLLLERLTQTLEHNRLIEKVVKLLIKDNSSLIGKIKGELERLYRPPWHLVQDSTYGVPDESVLNAYVASLPEQELQRVEIVSLLREYPPIAEVIEEINFLLRLERRLAAELVSVR